jgi:hypothetical protein
MSRNIVPLSTGNSTSRRHSAPLVRRVRFVSEAAAAARAVRSFRHPRPCVAIEDSLDLEGLTTVNETLEATRFTAVMIAPDTAAEARSAAERWIVTPGYSSVLSTVAFSVGGLKVQWRPGKALVQAPGDTFEGAFAALTDFAFYESELRRLEHALEEKEALAPADVARAHRIRLRDRNQWQRIGETIESLYRTRLQYARLESCWASAPMAASREARPLLERLIEETGIDDRLEAFSNALEACEDLYEGANDRIADHRWYLQGHWLEGGIIALLVVEIVLMTVDLYLKHAR